MGDVAFILACMLTIFAPLHWLVWRQMSMLDDPRHLRAVGVVILREEAIDAYGELIGRYADTSIHGTVTFMGMRYEYARVVHPDYAARVGENELYLPPGLLYRACG
ncbi:MAG: hypothetical protein MUF79_05530 [Burkholderiales bacterium]|jgi:hypothetical protein|nr:hypothetical protein [Burkholderiales bacterium]